MEIGRRETLILAIVAYFLGRFLVRSVRWLRENSISEAVLGGLLVSVVLSILTLFVGPFEFAQEGRDSLLLAFFATVGLEATWRRLAAGGKSLLILVGLAVLMLPVQSLIGAGAVWLTGGEPVYGVLGGSVALSGGAGTVLAWAPRFEALGFVRAEELGMAVASMGMLLGAVVGGPLGRWLVKRHGLRPAEERPVDVTSLDADDARPSVAVSDLLGAILAVAISVGFGLQAHDLLQGVGVEIPVFATTLLAGALLANTLPFVFPRVRSSAGTPAMGLVSAVSLNVFVAMAVMAVNLGAVFSAFVPILLLLILEVLVLVVYVVWVVFRAMGSDYDAAIISSGYFGLAMGATPIGVANMNAITRRLGPSPKALLVVPLIGLAFFDVIHVFVVELLLKILA